MFISKCFCPLVVMVLVTLTSCRAKETQPTHPHWIEKSLPPEKLQKSLSKINKYLEKNVKSDDVKANMEKLDGLMHDKLAQYSLFGGETLINAAKLFKEISELPIYEQKCDRDFRRNFLVEIIDPGLTSESRKKNPNYRLKRVDRLLQYLAYEDARRCNYSCLPRVYYAYKQSTYDAINKLLNEALPNTRDVEVSMETAGELLEKMEPQDGTIADGLRQLLSLKQTLDPDTCNERGFEILFKNDLATKRLGRKEHQLQWDRMARIFYHYAKRHEDLCRPLMPEIFVTELLKLERSTYVLVLGLVTSFYVDSHKYKILMDEMEVKKVDRQFYSPLLVDYYIKKELEDYRDDQLFELERVNSIGGWRLGQLILNEGRARNDPDVKYIEAPVRDKLKKVLDRYLFGPCERFLGVFGPLVEADEFSVNTNSDHTKNKKAEFLQNLTYHTVRAAVRACQYSYYNQEEVMKSIETGFGYNVYSNIKALNEY